MNFIRIRLWAVCMLTLGTLGFAGAAEGLVRADDNQSAREIELPNGDFEEGLRYWMLSIGSNDSMFRPVEGKDAYEGESAIIMELNPEISTMTYAYLGRRDLPTDPGFYRLRYAVRTNLKNGRIGAKIFAVDENDTNLLTVIPGQAGADVAMGTSPWHKYETIYQVPEGAATVILQLQMDDAEGKVWIDSVRVEKLNIDVAQSLMTKQISNHDANNHGAILLGEPCRNVSILQARLIIEPETDKQILVLNSGISNQHGSALFVDYEAGHTDVVPLPKGSGGWDFIKIPDGQLLFESLDPLHLIPIDIKTRQILADKITSISENTFAWQFARDDKGSIYFGSYPTGHAYRLRPDGDVEDLGRMGPEGNAYVRYIALTDDDYLLCSVWAEHSGIVAYHIPTKKQTWMPLEQGSPALKSVNGIVYATLGGKLQQFDTRKMEFRDTNLPTVSGVTWKSLSEDSTPERMLVTGSDMATYALDAGQSPRKIWTLPLRGGKIVGLDKKDRVIGVRGQDYFVAKPLADSISLQHIAENPPSSSIHFLRADPQGGVTGGPSLGQTLFRLDPNRNLAENTPQVVDGKGEVYDGRWIHGKFYFVSYSGGELGVWDPAKTWDQWNGKNPQVLAKYDSEQSHQLVRPQGGLVVGPGGKLYAGWSATYGLTSGGLTEYDLATDKSRVWESGRFAPEISIGSVTADDTFVYFVSSNDFNGLIRPEKPISFFVFDPSTEKIVFREELPSGSGRPKLVRVPETNNIWLATTLGLQRFDRTAMQLTSTQVWPNIPPSNAVDSADADGSHAWFAVGNNIVQLADIPTPQIEKLFQTTKSIQSLTAGQGQLFFTQDHQVWRVSYSE